MIKLSNREKIMLGALLVLLVFGVGTIYWILPMRDEIGLLNDEIALLEMQEKEMRSIIARTDSLVDDNDELVDEIDELIEFLTKPFLVEEFDLILLNLSNRNVVNVESIGYGGIEVTTPSAIESSSQKYELNLSQLLYAFLGIESETATNRETDSQILKQSINLSVNGSYSRLQDFLGELSNLGPTYFVKNVSYNRSEAAGESGRTVTETATITLDVYFLINEATESNDTE